MPNLSSYRKRAEKALGRKLQTHEHVHHHSATQLVICSREYHHWLHAQMRQLGIATPKPNGEVYIIRDVDRHDWKSFKDAAAKAGHPLKWLFTKFIREYPSTVEDTRGEMPKGKEK